MIYIGTNGYVACVDSQDGHEVWRTRLASGLFDAASRGTVTVMECRDILLAGCNGHLFGLDKKSGQIMWHNSLEGMGNYQISLCGQGQSVQYLQEVIHSQSST